VPATLQVTFHFIQAEPVVCPLWPLFLAMLAGFALANLVLFRGKLYELADRLLVHRLPGHARAKVEKLHSALQAYNLPLKAYGWTFVLSLAYQASEAALVWVLAWGLGLKLPFWVFGSMVMFQAVAGLLPISINNIGVREGIFCAVLLGQVGRLNLGVEEVKNGALALGLLYFGVVVASGLLGGLVYLAAGMPRPSAQEANGGEVRAEAAGQTVADAVAEPPA
jgi:hypothetical protein